MKNSILCAQIFTENYQWSDTYSIKISVRLSVLGKKNFREGGALNEKII
jgi:hypothetical protein